MDRRPKSPVHDIHGVFKRPQLSAFEMTREVIARAPPPAFLFPNQQCQRPGPAFRPAHRLAPDVGGGGYLSNLEFRVKPFFSKPSEPTHQKQPKPFPVNRSDLLKKAANQVKQRFQRNLRRLEEVTSEILANFLPLLPGTRLLRKAKPRVNFEFC